MHDEGLVLVASEFKKYLQFWVLLCVKTLSLEKTWWDTCWRVLVDCGHVAQHLSFLCIVPIHHNEKKKKELIEKIKTNICFLNLQITYNFLIQYTT